MDPGTPVQRERSWVYVIKSQDLFFIFVNLFVTAALIVVTSLSDTDTAGRSFALYDATISYAYKGASTIAFWVVGFVPFVSLLISLAVYEIFVATRCNTPIPLLTALASSLHFVIGFVFAGAVNGLITEVSKLLVGRFRPDWLSRCNPTLPPDIQPSFGLPASANPVCNSDLPESKLKDGHKSFPSGHASSAFALGIYVAGYVLYAAFFRPARRYAPYYNRPWRQRLMLEMGTTIAWFWILLQLGWAWGVSISRIIDNKHNASDSAAGALLGFLIGGAFLLRAIASHHRVMDPPPPQEQQPLLECASISRVANNA